MQHKCFWNARDYILSGRPGLYVEGYLVVPVLGVAAHAWVEDGGRIVEVTPGIDSPDDWYFPVGRLTRDELGDVPAFDLRNVDRHRAQLVAAWVKRIDVQFGRHLSPELLAMLRADPPQPLFRQSTI